MDTPHTTHRDICDGFRKNIQYSKEFFKLLEYSNSDGAGDKERERERERERE